MSSTMLQRILTHSISWFPTFLILSLIVIVLWAGGVVGLARSPSHPPNELLARPMKVIAQPLELSESYEVERSYLGQVESTRNSQLSFEFSGKLVKILVDEGDSIVKGDLLAELDTEILCSELKSLNAQVAAAKARLDELLAGPRIEVIDAATAQVERWHAQKKLAESTSRRQTQLIESNATSSQEYDEALFGEQVIRAQWIAAKSNLEELRNGTRTEKIESQRSLWKRLLANQETVEIQIRKSRLLAPYDGIVSRRRYDEGTVIQSGQPLLDVFDNINLEIRVGLPVALTRQTKALNDASFIYQGSRIAADLKSVRPEKNRATRTVDVLFELVESGNSLPVGEVVELRTKQKIFEPGYWIPSDALVEHYRGLWGCYVLKTSKFEETVQLTELELLHQKGQMAFVRGTIRTGDSIVISGVHRLVANQTVQSIDQDSLLVRAEAIGEIER